MRVIGLTVENFLRVEAAEIRPDGAMVVIAGPNEAGKSSVGVKAIWAAIEGAAAAPEKPIREGADRARLYVELGDETGPTLEVERIFTANNMRLVVKERREDGTAVRFDKPQAMLSALVSRIAFDPEAFSRMAPREQAAMLADLAGLDTSDLDAEYDRVYDERRDLGRRFRDFGVAPVPEGDRPDGVDVAALLDTLRSMREEESAYSAWGDTCLRASTDVQHAEDTVARLAGELAAAEIDLRNARAEHEAADAKWKSLDDPSDRIVRLESELAAAESRNATVRDWDAAAARVEARGKIEAAGKAKTARIDEIKAERAERVAAANMPVEGLSIEDDIVLYDGQPFSQASKGRSFDVSLAIGMAAKPKLRVLSIEHGSLLDSKMMSSVEKRCTEKGWQAFVERVADADSGVGIYIEDGVIVERGEDE